MMHGHTYITLFKAAVAIGATRLLGIMHG